MSAPVTPAPETLSSGQPALSEPQRIINTYVAPSKTFADIRRSAKWWGPFLLTLIVSYAFSFSVGKKVTWEQVNQTQMQMAPESRRQQLENLPPDQRARQEAISLKITKGIAVAIPFLATIFLIIVAAILMATFKFGVGAEVGFWQSVAIVMYASLPGVIRYLLAIVVVWMGVQDPSDFMIQNPFGSNPGYYMSFHDTPRFLYSVASAVDVFMIWTLILTAIGFSVVTKKSRGTSMAIVFGWWLLFVLVSSGLGAAFA
jgi:hypothetical protein